MNIESMKTTIVEAISKYRDFTEKNGQFIYRCIMSKWGDGAYPDIYRSLWEASDTYGEFIDKVERDERLSTPARLTASFASCTVSMLR